MTKDQSIPAATELNDDDLGTVEGGYLKITMTNATGGAPAPKGKRPGLGDGKGPLSGTDLGSGR